MTSSVLKRSATMTVAEFLAWQGDGTGRRYELVEGELRAQDHASDTHGTIKATFAPLIGNHLAASRPRCRVVAAPGIQPKLRAAWNYRVPELAVTCAPTEAGVHRTPDPLLIIEILSPSNAADTWSNVALFATLPSVTEILVVESEQIGAHLLRRGPDGTWPEDPRLLGAGDALELVSIGYSAPLSHVYQGTHLAAG